MNGSSRTIASLAGARLTTRNGHTFVLLGAYNIDTHLAKFIRNGVSVNLTQPDPQTGRTVTRTIEAQPRYSVSVVKPWPKDFPNATSITTRDFISRSLGELFAKAKSGDGEASMNLIDALMQDPKRRARVLDLKKAHPNASIVAPVHAEEAGGRNAIPFAFAQYIADTLGADAWHRLTDRAMFAGRVEPGREYILVDDHITQGGTINELLSFIENYGGKVVAVAALTLSKGSGIISPRKETIDELKRRYPNGELEQLLKDADIATAYIAARKLGGTDTSRADAAKLAQSLGLKDTAPDDLLASADRIADRPRSRLKREVEESSPDLIRLLADDFARQRLAAALDFAISGGTQAADPALRMFLL